MLKHADRHDAVERPFNIAVVFELKTHPVVEAAVNGALAGQLQLFRRQRNAHHLHIGHLRQIKRHAAPAAADIQNALAGFQVQFRGDVAQLVLLGGFKRVLSSAKYAQE